MLAVAHDPEVRCDVILGRRPRGPVAATQSSDPAGFGYGSIDQPMQVSLSQIVRRGTLIMNKRMFLKLSAGILGGSSGGRLFGRMPDRSKSGAKLTNWAGNYAYSTDNLHRLASIEQVRRFVKGHDSLRVLGTRHSFNGIADSTQTLISLEPMNQVIALDLEAHTVTVEAGMKYGQLCPYLHDKGFALHNLASLPHISIAGACATATHGSGIKNGNLATAVSAVELVTADGS